MMSLLNCTQPNIKADGVCFITNLFKKELFFSSQSVQEVGLASMHNLTLLYKIYYSTRNTHHTYTVHKKYLFQCSTLIYFVEEIKKNLTRPPQRPNKCVLT